MSARTSKGTALITGASTGIGAVYADRLAKRGYDLILVARSQERLSEVAARLKSTGRGIETISADLTKKEDVQRVAERLSADSTITALVNNAGLGSAGKLLDSKIDDLEAMIYLNVTALTRLALAALPGFVARKDGLLINIASVVALAPDLLNGTYSGTKACRELYASAEERIGGNRSHRPGCAAWSNCNAILGQGRSSGGTPAERDRDDRRGHGRRLPRRTRPARTDYHSSPA